MEEGVEWCRAVVATLAALLGACGGSGGERGAHDAGGGSCSADEECPAEAPVCDRSTGGCVACESSSESCGRFDGTPYCVDGGCVGCGDAGESDWCTERNSMQPVCESETGQCRGCEANLECDSGACARGECVPEDESIYVAPGGIATSDCTKRDPCATIARGFEVAEALRRTVVLADGSYDEPVVVSVDSLVESMVGDGAIVERSTAGPVIRIRDNGINLERIVVRGATGSNGHGIHCSGTGANFHYVRAMQLVVRENARSGVLADDCSAELLECVVEDNTGVGVLLSGAQSIGTLNSSWVRRNTGGGVDMDTGLYAILNSVVADNGNPVDAEVGGLVLHFTGLEGANEVKHVTVVRNSIASASDRNSGVHCIEPPGRFTNSIAWENEGSAAQVGVECLARYMLVSPGTFPGGEGNLAGEPAFVDPDDGDYDLGAASDAIDRGDPGGGLQIDIHGDLRGEHEQADLGADEYVP